MMRIGEWIPWEVGSIGVPRSRTPRIANIGQRANRNNAFDARSSAARSSEAPVAVSSSIADAARSAFSAALGDLGGRFQYGSIGELRHQSPNFSRGHTEREVFQFVRHPPR